MRISVIGTGYVGLITGTCLAEKGHRVICVDKDVEKIEKIRGAQSPIFEKGLEELIRRNINANLEATTDLRNAIMKTEVSFITVDTPFVGSKIDLSYVTEVSKSMGAVLKDKKNYHLVVVKSTVVPGTTDDVVIPILEEKSGKKAGEDFGVGVNPEFLREGNAVEDFMYPDRVVLGGIDEKSVELLSDLYDVFDGVEKVRTDTKTAEMIKYVSNALFATMISFSNEIGNLCAAAGIDAVTAMKAVHLDRRLSPLMPDGNRIIPHLTTYLEAGCGFGGSCLPKDVKSLVAYGEEKGIPMRILKEVSHVNEEQPYIIIKLLKKHFTSLKDLRVAVLGLAFKPGTDDIRESPSLVVIRELKIKGGKVKTYDPLANRNAKRLFSDERIIFCDSLSATIEDTEVIIILTRCPEFENIPELIARRNPQPLVIDGRRMLNRESVARYEGIGL